VQRRELDYGLFGAHPEPERNAIFRIDFDDPRITWQVADGDTEIAPGVTAVLTAGHTPGHQSFVIDLEVEAASSSLSTPPTCRKHRRREAGGVLGRRATGGQPRAAAAAEGDRCREGLPAGAGA